MNLKIWVKNNFKVTRRTELASDVARQFLKATNQPIEPWLINKVIFELHDLDLLCGPPNHPTTQTRLVEVTT